MKLKTITGKLAFLLPSAVLLFGGLTANADSIDVPNASFDLTSPAVTSTNTSIAEGWNFNVGGGDTFGIGTISQDFTSSGSSSGTNYAFIDDASDPGATDTISSASSLGTVASDTTYTLTVAMGSSDGSDATTADDYVFFGLTANGNPFVVDPIPESSVPEGTFQDFSFSFTTASDIAWAGENLGIEMGSLAEPDSAFQASFDNVRLDASDPAAVPEPPGWVLLLAGLFTLSWLLRRQLSSTQALV